MRFSIALIVCVFTLSSCDVFQREGCTDSGALNYDEKADITDYSCIYDFQGVIHWDITTHSNFVTAGVTHLTISMDGENVIQNSPITKYTSATAYYPSECSDTTWIPVNNMKSYGGSHKVNLQVYNQNDSLIHQQPVLLQTHYCQKIKVDYY